MWGGFIGGIGVIWPEEDTLGLSGNYYIAPFGLFERLSPRLGGEDLYWSLGTWVGIEGWGMGLMAVVVVRGDGTRVKVS